MKAMPALALVAALCVAPGLPAAEEKPAAPAKAAEPAKPSPTPRDRRRDAKMARPIVKPPTTEAESTATLEKPIPPKANVAVPKGGSKAAAASPTEKGQAYQFDGTNLIETLRKLAREARVNLVISNGVMSKRGSETLTMMLVDTEPLQVLQIAAQQKGLSLERVANIYYLLTPGERAARLNRLDDSALPQSLARYKQRYLEALREAGFTRDEALRIIISEPVLPESLKTGLVEVE